MTCKAHCISSYINVAWEGVQWKEAYMIGNLTSSVFLYTVSWYLERARVNLQPIHSPTWFPPPTKWKKKFWPPSTFFPFCIVLKGVWHEIFNFRFFSKISVPRASEYLIGIISNFFENSRRYSRMNVCQRCQRHRRKKIKFWEKIF